MAATGGRRAGGWGCSIEASPPWRRHFLFARRAVAPGGSGGCGGDPARGVQGHSRGEEKGGNSGSRTTNQRSAKLNQDVPATVIQEIS